MSYIYVITNQINQKQYVGKTNRDIQTRFQEHCRQSNLQQNEQRPLYNAMNKYGVENFTIALLEQCSEKDAATKEIYWIGKLNTYEQGYNATLGGDSKQYYNYQEIANKYLELQSQKDTADFFQCDILTVRTACQAYNIPIISSVTQMKKNYGQSVLLIEENLIFDTLGEAALYLQQHNKTTNKSTSSIIKNIAGVCKGNRKTAYGYTWRYVTKE